MARKILPKVTDEVEKLFQKAQNIFFFVGSGISVGSGIPSFRGLQEMDYFEEYFPMFLSSQEGLQKKSEVCWRFFKHLHEIINKAEPNIAHKTIATLQQKAKEKGKNVTVLTLAYDGLLIKAGVENVLELHGNINLVVCSKCTKYQKMIEIELNPNQMPTCECGGFLRPNIVLLDESVKEEIYDNGTIAARKADLYFSIGTSGVHKHSKYFFSELVGGATTIEINPIPTYLSRFFQFVLREKAEIILPQFKS